MIDEVVKSILVSSTTYVHCHNKRSTKFYALESIGRNFLLVGLVNVYINFIDKSAIFTLICFFKFLKSTLKN